MRKRGDVSEMLGTSCCKIMVQESGRGATRPGKSSRTGEVVKVSMKLGVMNSNETYKHGSQIILAHSATRMQA